VQRPGVDNSLYLDRIRLPTIRDGPQHGVS